MAESSLPSVRGFRDLLPEEAELTSAVEACAREVLGHYGFSEIRLPTLEYQELFVKSTGETTDIVEKEMFQLEDQGGRKLALRPEGTPGVVRAFINHHLSQQGAVSKLFYAGSMFRAERPQKGRYREFEQIGVETLGNAHPAADAEAIAALSAFFVEAGLAGQFRLRLNNLGCDRQEACRPAYRKALKDFLISRRDGLCDTCKTRIERNPLRALDCKKDGEALRAAAPRLAPCADCAGHFDFVVAALKADGIGPVDLDPNLVRGLDYYTRTVFEFTSAGVGSQDALAGGGRYDGLVEAMGGQAVPAVGWALGVERTLLAVLAADPKAPRLSRYRAARDCEVFVVAATKETATAAAAAATLERLRRFGLRAGGGLFGSSLKAQMKEASRQQARFAVLLGEDELKKTPPSCQLKDMASGEQSERPLAELPEALGDKLLNYAPTVEQR